jgi:hypothetical protein
MHLTRIAERPGEGLLTEPTTDAQRRQRKRTFVLRFGHSQTLARRGSGTLVFY